MSLFRSPSPCCWLVAAFVLAAPVPAGAGHQAATPATSLRSERLQPCRVPGLDESVLCGELEVPENRAVPSGRTIRLKVVVLPAFGQSVERDALTFLAGGGVVPATRFAGLMARSFKALREHRDVLLVDQRGTGGSNRLGCRIPENVSIGARAAPAPYQEALRRCRAELESRADLRFYTTAHAIDDLDAVRAWLGYEQLDLFGSSYGTFVAQAYLRQYPDRVRTLALTGPMPLDAVLWQEQATHAQAGLDRVFAACAAQPGCASAFPGLRQEFQAVLERLAAEPVSVAVETEGGHKTVVVDDLAVRDLVYGGLSSSRPMADIPRMIHQLFLGNVAEAGHVLAEQPPDDAGPPKGVFLTLLCAEQMSRVDPAVAIEAAGATFVRDWIVKKPMLECGEWVRANVPPGFFEPVRSKVPALVLVGDLDSVTPPAYARRLATTLPGARLVVVPAKGHGDADPCALSMVEQLVLAGRPDTVDTGCTAKIPPLTFRAK